MNSSQPAEPEAPTTGTQVNQPRQSEPGLCRALHRDPLDLSRRASPGACRGLPHEGEPMTVLQLHYLGWDPHSEYLGFCGQAWTETLVLLRRWAEARSPGRH